MRIISKKNIYLLSVFVVSLLLLVIIPTYAKFPSNYTASDNMVGLVLDFNVSITNLEEYEEIVIEPNSYEKFNVKITNNLGHDAFYGIWYRMVEPATINSNIQVGKLYGTSVNTSGSIKSGVDTTATLIIKNNTSNQIKIDVGIATSDTSTSDIEYLNGKKLISSTVKLLLRDVEAGSYVQYTGNNGCSGKACEGQNANYVDSSNMGYCVTSTYVFTVNGWRVGYVSDSTAYIVSAGAPECYGTPNIPAGYVENIEYQKEYPPTLYEQNTFFKNYSFNTSTGIYTLSGDNFSVNPSNLNDFETLIQHADYYTCNEGTTSSCSTMYQIAPISATIFYNYYTSIYNEGGAPSAETHISNLNTEALKYCNSTYAYGGKCNADSTWNMRANDFERITGKPLSGSSCWNVSNNITCGFGNDLIGNGSYYWYATQFDSHNVTFFWAPDRSSVYGSPSVGKPSLNFGLRPVVRTKASVYITGGEGTMTSPYTIGV